MERDAQLTWVNSFSDTDHKNAEPLKDRKVEIVFTVGKFGNDMVSMKGL